MWKIFNNFKIPYPWCRHSLEDLQEDVLQVPLGTCHLGTHTPAITASHTLNTD